MLNPSANRMGTESAFAVLARAGVLSAQGHDIINLGIGQPDFKTPQHIVEAGIKALQDGAHGYTPSLGLPELRTTVADDLKNRYGGASRPGPHSDCARRKTHFIYRNDVAWRSGA